MFSNELLMKREVWVKILTSFAGLCVDTVLFSFYLIFINILIPVNSYVCPIKLNVCYYIVS